MSRARSAAFALLTILLAGVAPAATWYVDPVHGSPSGDGSAANPWPSLQWVVDNNRIESMKPAAYPYAEGEPLVVRNAGAPVRPGDTILLRSGDHGDVWIIGYFNTDWITLKADEGPERRHRLRRQAPGRGA